MGDISIGDIKGRQVLDSKGNTLGKVKDVSIDPERWGVTGLVVELDREVADDLNVEKGMFAKRDLTFRPDRVATVGDSLILNVNQDEVAGLLRGQR